MKKIIIVFTLILCMCSCTTTNEFRVVNSNWSNDVKTAINDFIDSYGKESGAYVVSDFDNTASIFDMSEQFLVYQAQVMGYCFTPQELPLILASGLGDLNKDLTCLGYGNGSYNDWISDITSAYTYLYNNYGPFKPEGLNDEESEAIQKDPMWAEFTAKILNMYFLIGDNESTLISYPWITYFFTGMTEYEVYKLARQSHAKYRNVNTSQKTIQSPDSINSKVGVTAYTYVQGVQVSENTKEMWQKLNESGIDVWVCSASQVDIIRAAVDEFGLHDYCTGLIGMTPAIENGKLSYTYDYTTGYCWYTGKDGTWRKGTVATGSQPQGKGKVTAIQNVCVKEYGTGPLAGFMDSTGDFNFCTEFENLKLVICFNRADRDVTDGGSVIAELAMYQKDILGYNLKKANNAGDTLYVMQGRNENGLRTLLNSNKTIKLGQTEETLYKNEKNLAVYAYLSEKKLTTENFINKFALKTESDSENNPLGFCFGFLDSYDGYHSK